MVEINVGRHRVVEKRVIDWETVEKEYRAGIRSLRHIADEFEITEGTIRSRAKKEDWIRDLSAKIKTKTNDILRKTELRKELRKETEKEIVESVAQSQADVLLNERADIKRLSGLCKQFEDELEVYKDDLDKKARIMKSLTDTRKIIIELRRRNYNINDNSNGDADKNTHEHALDQLR